MSLIRNAPEDMLLSLHEFFKSEPYQFLDKIFHNASLGIAVKALGIDDKEDTQEKDLAKLYRGQGQRFGLTFIFAIKQEVDRERERRLNKRDAELKSPGGAAAADTK